jgi:hypothetical protein
MEESVLRNQWWWWWWWWGGFSGADDEFMKCKNGLRFYDKYSVLKEAMNFSAIGLRIRK